MPPVTLCQRGRRFGIFGKYRTSNEKEKVTFRRHDKTH